MTQANDNGRWTADRIPDMTGKVVIITGANSGIGYEAALVLAGRGARVVMACRNQEKASTARQRILDAWPGAMVELLPLDLAHLASVCDFAGAFRSAFDRLDVLINNAGVMAIPYRQTPDGFEMQFGTNHLGHFALTGHLIDMLLATPAARIVNVSSNAHRFGRINFDDLNARRSYRRWRADSQSKLANLLFTLELQKRLAAVGTDVLAASCHPGYASTNLQQLGSSSVIVAALTGVANRLFAQSAAMGALPTLYASVAEDIEPGDYIGPDGFRSMQGYPVKEQAIDAAYDAQAAARLWDESVALTGVAYEGFAAVE